MSRKLHARRIEGVDKNICFIQEAFCKAVNGGVHMHQYTRAFGHPALVKILAKFYSGIVGQEIDPMEDVLVTVGAYQALYCTFQALIDEGDEVIIVEPFFDCYQPMVKMAGGTAVYVPLKPREGSGPAKSSAEWVLSPEELKSKFTPRTKAIVINTPNNPLGKVYLREELQMIADLCIKHDVVCISDEVYEWLTYDGTKHVKIGKMIRWLYACQQIVWLNVTQRFLAASLPGMWERTVTIGSAGKTFSATGWKVGWAIGSHLILKHLKTVHQNSVYHCATAAQVEHKICVMGVKHMSFHFLTGVTLSPVVLKEAVAVGFQREYDVFGTEESYFQQLPALLHEKRLRLADCLRSIGLNPIIPQGGYFMIADISNLSKFQKSGSTKYSKRK
ncbi:Kynurenine--oxoglutarate transaminase 1 [Triplophysa tibetana]|uniref:Kynurenine--oxoglutarate transaminase 1 n=1 Tax=Triplophysa tibetana TaxID=1572043 RepID=A0A5A9P5C5_9TELE|nr:Kynurenine--oxoglutarate transaminase 1 [Triplophysa tibetana]